MLSKTFTAAALALATSSLVSAQTFTDCDPTKKDCRPDPAFGSRKAECNFLNGACDVFETLPGTTLSYDKELGAVFSIEKETNAPTVETGRYMFFGRLDVECQPAYGQGIVTSIVLESDDLDEIDLEWVGGDDEQVQTNYFSKGDTTTYDRGAYHTVDKPLTSFHTYSIEWTSKAIVWYVNGSPIRTLTYEDAKGGSTFPQTPMQVKLGSWVAGRKDAPKGTVEWAGGYTDFSQAPFNAYYKSVKITDYAGGNKAATGDIKEYVYGDKTGSYESIKVIKGDGSSDDDEKTTTTTTKAATKTKTHESTKTKDVETETDAETETESETKTKSKSTATTTVATTLTTAVTTAADTTTADQATATTTEPTETASTVPNSAAGAKSVSMAGLVVAGVVAAALF